MKISELNIENFFQIQELEGQLAENYVKTTTEEIQHILNNPNTCRALGIFKNNKLIAWGSYFSNFLGTEEGEYHIHAIFVDKNYRRKGLGKKILNELVQKIKITHKYKKITLVTSPNNINAIILYLNNGFIITDYKKDYYGPGNDRLILTYSNP